MVNRLGSTDLGTTIKQNIFDVVGRNSKIVFSTKIISDLEDGTSDGIGRKINHASTDN